MRWKLQALWEDMRGEVSQTFGSFSNNTDVPQESDSEEDAA